MMEVKKREYSRKKRNTHHEKLRSVFFNKQRIIFTLFIIVFISSFLINTPKSIQNTNIVSIQSKEESNNDANQGFGDYSDNEDDPGLYNQDQITPNLPNTIEEPKKTDDISYYEKHFIPSVSSRLPQSSYIEDYGWWLKGDPTVHTSDGDVPLFSMNDKSVDELCQMAIAEGLDWIGITNLDKYKIYIPRVGDVELEANLQDELGAIQRARVNYHGQIKIFYGVEKSIGLIDYFGAGKRIQCLLPYNPSEEWNYMQDLLQQTTVQGVLDAMDQYHGLEGELGTAILSLNEAFLDVWTQAEVDALANSACEGGVLSVTKDTVNDFVQFSSDPTGRWDDYLSKGKIFYGNMGSDYYISSPGGPGQVTKTYVKVWGDTYWHLMEGFKIGRMFSVQNDIIDSLDISLSDNYDNIARMSDTIKSYGNQTLKIKLHYNTPLQNVKVITNYEYTNQIYKTFTSSDFKVVGDNEIEMECVFPHFSASYFVRVEGEDASGNKFFSAPIFYELSNIVFPEIHITQPAQVNSYANTATLHLEWTESGSSPIYNREIEVWDYYNPDATSIDTGNLGSYRPKGTSYDVTLKKDAWNTIMVRGEDLWGNVGKDMVFVYYDKSRPVVNIQYPINSSYINHQNITTTWTASAAEGFNIDNFTIQLDSNSPITGIDPDVRSYDFTNLAEGKHTFSITVYQDGNYKSNQQSVVFYIDVTKPLVDFLEPTNGTIYNENSTKPDIRWNAGDLNPYGQIDHYEFQFYKNGELVDNITVDNKTKTYEIPWENGHYQAHVVCYDKAGNMEFEDLYYTIDFNLPSVVLEPAYYSAESSANVTWYASDVMTWINSMQITYKSTTYDLSNTTNSYYFTGLSEGENYFTLTVTDASGHKSIKQSTIIMDTTPPLLYNLYIDDQFYLTGYRSYFKIGVIAKDDLSDLKQVTLYYSLYNNPDVKLSDNITKAATGLTEIQFSLSPQEIFTMMKNQQTTLSFYVIVENNAGLTTISDSYEYTIRLKITRNSSLSALEVAGIIGIVLVSAGVIGFIANKLYKRRLYGDLARWA